MLQKPGATNHAARLQPDLSRFRLRLTNRPKQRPHVWNRELSIIMSAPLSTPSRFAGLTPLLAPRSIAVIGASSDATRIGGRPIAYMQAQGFPGALYPVNPNRAEILGLKAYPSIAALPETPDVAIVAVPAELAAPAIEDLGKRGVKAVVMFTAGFAEMDDDGAAAQVRWSTRARGMACASSAPIAWACSTPDAPTMRPSPPRSTAAGRCQAASASPASPAPTARISIRWHATAASAPRCAS